jgi:hypothetical protein
VGRPTAATPPDAARLALRRPDKLARHFAIAHHKQEWLFAQLLQRGWLIAKLFDIGKAAFAQHAVNDARHRIELFNSQQKVSCLRTMFATIVGASPTPAIEWARQVRRRYLHGSSGYQAALDPFASRKMFSRVEYRL